MEKFFSFTLESRSPIRHYTFALRCSDLATEIRLSGFAELTLSTFGCALCHQVSAPLSREESIQAHTIMLRRGLLLLQSSPLHQSTRQYQLLHDPALWGMRLQDPSRTAYMHLYDIHRYNGFGFGLREL